MYHVVYTSRKSKETLHGSSSGGKEEIQAFTRELVRSVGSGKLIVGADCSLPSDIDPERIRWIIEALEAMA